MSKNIPDVGFDILEVSDTFVRGRIDLEDMATILFDIDEEVSQVELENGTIGNEDDDDCDDPSIRISQIAWLDQSKIAKKMIKQVVQQVNSEFFDLNIKDKPPEYQYTLYLDPDDHYDWHQDHYEDDEVDYRRTLSLSLCLTASDMYEGAELFLRDGNEFNVRVFKMGFGEFILFPSEVEHRVNALRRGERCSLVVWYGYKQDSKGFK